MRRYRFRSMLRGTSVARISLLVLLTVPLALAHTARLVLEDGRPFPETPLILPPLGANSCFVHEIGLDGTILYTGPPAEYVPPGVWTTESKVTTDVCQAAFLIKGYGKVTVTLRDRALIVVKRYDERAEGPSISIATLQAPAEARKAWEKGVKALGNKKWPQAEKELRRAVTMHPEYASAWSALGEALLEMSRPAEARAAWNRAIQSDPNYVKPYVLLASLALREGRMEDAASITGRALEARYTQTVPVYFYHAAANLALGRLDAAEKSARKAVELDPAHGVPKAEHLLGNILAAKGDRRGAAEHLKKYLEASPKADDARQIRQLIAELDR
jgi:Flp pilus assembly protein TadD